MAKDKKETKLDGLSPNEMMKQVLNDNKEDHYNFEESIDYKVSSGSFTLDYLLDGGFNAGLHRFFGPYESGKTSEALQVMKNFLITVPFGRGIYFKAEGRLSNDMIRNSGISFVNDADDWEDGTCFIMESNIYDFVANTMRSFVLHDVSKTKYCFILDSVDGLIPKKDVGKDFSDSQKIAGGAVIASVLMKEIALPLAKRGHMAIFISQNRSPIQLSTHSKEVPRKEGGTGGNALLHFPNWMLEFERQYFGDNILKDPNSKYDAEKNPIIGRNAKVAVLKSPNEKTGTRHSYPICYGRAGGKSIWVEKELIDMLLSWGLVTKGGSWYKLDASLVDMLTKEQLIKDDAPKSFQGEQKLFSWLEENEEITSFLIEYFKQQINEV